MDEPQGISMELELHMELNTPIKQAITTNLNTITLREQTKSKFSLFQTFQNS